MAWFLSSSSSSLTLPSLSTKEKWQQRLTIEKSISFDDYDDDDDLKFLPK